jgi:hypothetical protein
MNRIASRARWMPLALVGAALVLAGCGGGRSASSADTPTTTIETGGGFVVEPWHGADDNTHTAHGRVLLDGRPVANAGLRVDGYRLRSDSGGRFSYRVDSTLARRYRISIDDLSSATVGGDKLSDAERGALRRASGEISVAYRIVQIDLAQRPDGTVALRGRLVTGAGTPPPAVVLFSYRLAGQIRDASGHPLAKAIVLTRSAHGEGSTFSTVSDSRGRYQSFYWPPGEEPVTFGVAMGDQSWELPTPLRLPRFGSARVDVHLGQHGSIALPRVTDEPGAFYEGLLVGPLLDGSPVAPLAATWPDEHGFFELVLPARARRATLSFYEAPGYYFSRAEARPGGAVLQELWPGDVPEHAPRVSARIPGRAP